MGLATRGRTRIVLVVLVALALAAALDTTLLVRAQSRNAAIASGAVPDDVSGQPAEMRFARAHALATKGQDDAAQTAYRALQDDTPLGQAARFNTANSLVRQAMRDRANAQAGQAVPLLELAKETYREILRADPAHWDARYNLERAQRLLPDPEEDDGPPATAPNNAERAATTMRGVSQGLP